MSNSKIVTMAARNVRPGDHLIWKINTPGCPPRTHEHPVLKVERLDFGTDMMLVGITYRDNGTVGKVEQRTSFKVTERILVRKGEDREEFYIDWTPKKVEE